MGQAAALAALQDVEFIAFCREENKKGLAYFRQAFEDLGLKAFPAYGNFIMVDVQRPGQEVFEALLRKGVIIRAGHKQYPTSVRITVGNAEQNAKVVAALTAVLKEIAVKV